MPSAGFEPATPATKRPQTYVLDRAATEVGEFKYLGALITANNNLTQEINHGLLQAYINAIFPTGAYSPGRTFGLPFQGFLITHTDTR
jgi:hypothetical protein